MHASMSHVRLHAPPRTYACHMPTRAHMRASAPTRVRGRAPSPPRGGVGKGGLSPTGSEEGSSDRFHPPKKGGGIMLLNYLYGIVSSVFFKFFSFDVN